MQAASPAYNPYGDSVFSNMRVSFRLVDTTAYADASPSVSESEPGLTQMDQLHDLVDGMSAKWATFETQGWRADGSYSLIPDDLTSHQTGWWSNLSGENGSFASPPTLTFEFTADHSSIGFTVIFDDRAGRHPLSMTVYAYDAAETLIDAQTVVVTSARQVVDMPVENYRKLVIEFGDTQLPYQRVRVAEVIFGIVQYFDRSNIRSGEMIYEISPTAEFLPSTELELVFDNNDGKYNMGNPEGVYEYLQQGQPMDTEIGVGPSAEDIEYVTMGRVFYSVSAAEDDSMTASIVAHDPFFTLDQSTCRIGTTGTWTLSEAAAAIAADSGLDIVINLPAELGSRIIKKSLPAVSHREAFRLAAQAAKCTCFFNRANELQFVEFSPGSPAAEVNEDNMEKPAKPKDLGRINKIELIVKDEFAGTESLYAASNILPGETARVKPISNPLAHDGEDVSAWLLSMYQNRITYDTIDPGNPALEVLDTITVTDNYGIDHDVVILRQHFMFDGTLSADMTSLQPREVV